MSRSTSASSTRPNLGHSADSLQELRAVLERSTSNLSISVPNTDDSDSEDRPARRTTPVVAPYYIFGGRRSENELQALRSLSKREQELVEISEALLATDLVLREDRPANGYQSWREVCTRLFSIHLLS